MTTQKEKELKAEAEEEEAEKIKAEQDEALINEEVDSLEAELLIIEEEEEELPEVTIYGQELFRNNIIKVLNKNDEINAPDKNAGSKNKDVRGKTDISGYSFQ